MGLVIRLLLFKLEHKIKEERWWVLHLRAVLNEMGAGLEGEKKLMILMIRWQALIHSELHVIKSVIKIKMGVFDDKKHQHSEWESITYFNK